jgi:hypothetical protein
MLMLISDEVDLIQLSVFSHRFMSIAEQMLVSRNCALYIYKYSQFVVVVVVVVVVGVTRCVAQQFRSTSKSDSTFPALYSAPTARWLPTLLICQSVDCLHIYFI